MTSKVIRRSDCGNLSDDYKKNVAVGTGSSPTTLGGSGFAGRSGFIAIISDRGADADSVFLVVRLGLIEPLR
jgi:hypothetical protein